MLGIIKKPLISEKNTMHNSIGTYVFEVDRRANKIDVKKVVEKLFRVKVKEVRTVICRSKERVTKKGIRKKRYWKKAFVKLAVGEKISLFEGA